MSWADDDHTNEQRIQLEITTYLGDRQTFVEGDKLSFLVTLNQDAYLLVLYETAEHQLLQLLPHKYSTVRKYSAGYYIPVPDDTARYQFIIAPPFGSERILAFASDREFPLLQGKDLANGLRLLSDSTAQVVQQLRDNTENQERDYGEARMELTTRAH